MSYKAKSTPLKSPRRRRTERQAIMVLDEARLPATQRRHALARIRGARQPITEARRIIDQTARLDVAELGCDDIGLADVQELRVKLARRDGGVWSPQSILLRRMDRRIAGEGMTRPEFDDLAAAVWRMAQVLPSGTRHAA